MSDSVEISFESKCICYLLAVLKEGDKITASAKSTGFFWRHEGVPYLITNRHCVTGRDGSNSEIGSFFPNALQIYFWEKGGRHSEDSTYHQWKGIEAALWEDGHPAWLEHSLGSKIDLAALPLNSPRSISVNCVNDMAQYDTWKIRAGADCFIVGYPEGVSGPSTTPIWKRGSIASEPQLDYVGLPVFLCDSATRSGMSGSPVFGKAEGLFDGEAKRIDPYSTTTQFLSHFNIFLGIYSGREGKEQDGFQLGRVWKRSALEELLLGQKLATDPANISG